MDPLSCGFAAHFSETFLHTFGPTNNQESAISVLMFLCVSVCVCVCVHLCVFAIHTDTNPYRYWYMYAEADVNQRICLIHFNSTPAAADAFARSSTPCPPGLGPRLLPLQLPVPSHGTLGPSLLVISYGIQKRGSLSFSSFGLRKACAVCFFRGGGLHFRFR